jgi:hypothetical protein
MGIFGLNGLAKAQVVPGAGAQRPAPTTPQELRTPDARRSSCRCALGTPLWFYIFTDQGPRRIQETRLAPPLRSWGLKSEVIPLITRPVPTRHPLVEARLLWQRRCSLRTPPLPARGRHQLVPGPRRHPLLFSTSKEFVFYAVA